MIKFEKAALKNAQEQILLIFCNTNGRAFSKTSYEVIQKFNLRDSISAYVNDKKFSAKDISGSVQSFLLREERKIVLCIYTFEDGENIEYEDLKMGLLNVGHRCRAPLAMALDSHSNVRVSAQIRALVGQTIKNCDVVIYKGV